MNSLQMTVRGSEKQEDMDKIRIKGQWQGEEEESERITWHLFNIPAYTECPVLRAIFRMPLIASS